MLRMRELKTKWYEVRDHINRDAYIYNNAMSWFLVQWDQCKIVYLPELKDKDSVSQLGCLFVTVAFWNSDIK